MKEVELRPTSLSICQNKFYLRIHICLLALIPSMDSVEPILVLWLFHHKNDK